MVFSEPIFLFLFLPIALILYFIMPGMRSKNLVLTMLSLLFYAWGEPVWVALLILTSLLHYCFGKIIARNQGKQHAKHAVITVVIVSLGLLAAFKYANFIIANINTLTGLNISESKLTLPIGISFYTFQTLTYSIDVYRGNVNSQKSFINFLLFVSLFPQLIAGPILRYSDIETQLAARKTTLPELSGGITRFLCGLGKKVLLANYAGAVAERLLSGNSPTSHTVVGAWLGIVLFAFQIYFDFSGYSDMAIGLGKMFGFSYPENFRYPYMSKSITEFWRRWHISLGSFFRDYVYIPLGGNRKGLITQICNMLIVWALTGLWHGAGWSFVIWGLWSFVFLFVEKLIGETRLEKIPGFVRMPYAFIVVVIGWVFFYFTKMSDAVLAISTMFGNTPGGFVNSEVSLTLINSTPLIIICFLASSDVFVKIYRRFVPDTASSGTMSVMSTISTVIYNSIILALCTISIMGSTFNPFIYFRF